jgi:hypothetical protein
VKTFNDFFLKGADGPAKGPTTAQLSEALEDVIFEWTRLSTITAGKPVAGPAEMELEYSIHIPTPQPCRLVLRANRELAAELAHAATGDPGARLHSEAAFQELCHQTAQRLAGVAKAFLPKRSRPDVWPPRPPEAETVILVGYWPLEARLWAESHPKED